MLSEVILCTLVKKLFYLIPHFVNSLILPYSSHCISLKNILSGKVYSFDTTIGFSESGAHTWMPSSFHLLVSVSVEVKENFMEEYSYNLYIQNLRMYRVQEDLIMVQIFIRKTMMRVRDEGRVKPFCRFSGRRVTSLEKVCSVGEQQKAKLG